MPRKKISLKKAINKKRALNRNPPVYLGKAKVLKAIEGSGGILVAIQKKLECAYPSLLRCLARPSWEDVRIALLEEKERLADSAERTIQEAIEQREDWGIATANARWYLERKHGVDRGYRAKKEVTLEGGETPLHMRQAVLPIETLDLPIEVKVQLLEAIERREGQNDA